ncbi:MAG: FAD:protein FMN transferase [Sedimentisphaerales bacterium]|jgi:thiamine biosynthesis lipoprotein|nr:FAD:protein FMN transferase [Sedimentisphaerales bacterium]
MPYGQTHQTGNRTIALAIVVGAIVFGLLVIGLLGKIGPMTIDSGQRPIMGTFGRVVVVARDRATALACIEAAFEQHQDIEAMMSFHRPDSVLSQINAQAFHHPVVLPGPLFELIQRALEISRVSGGAFDVTVGPLVALWRQAGTEDRLPTDQQIGQALQRVGFERLILDPNTRTIRFAVEGMSLDLGGIAKGYAVDRSIQVLQERGALGGMVDIGGNIRCFGRPPGRARYWTIGVQDPTQVSGQDGIAMALRLTGQAVATSGHYYRFEQIKGRRYSHIIDPRTGRPTDAPASVTVIALDATTADGLSTAIMVLGSTAGLQLAEQLVGVEAIVMEAGRLRTLMTKGVGSLLVDRSLVR